MSMRPQRCCPAPMAAASVASLVTSASKATQSPPARTTIATVSSADARSRSTALTRADDDRRLPLEAHEDSLGWGGTTRDTVDPGFPAYRIFVVAGQGCGH